HAGLIFHALLEQPVVSVNVPVGEDTNKVAVAVTGGVVVVAGPIPKDEVRGILYTGNFLMLVPSAEMQLAAAHDSMTADIVVHVDGDDGDAMLCSFNGSG